MRPLLLSLFCFLSFNLFGQLFGPEIELTETTVVPRKVRTGDLDNDGDIDILCSSANDGKIVWFENFGGGIFGNQIVIRDVVVGIASLDLIDFDQDGDFDVVYDTWVDDEISWYRNDGNGNFDLVQPFLSSIDYPGNVNVTEINGDGILDVLVTSYSDNSIVWIEQDFNGNLIDDHIISSGTSSVSDSYPADIDGDGDKDVLISLSSTDQIVWFQNYGNGLFSNQIIITELTEKPSKVLAVDIDNDGDKDVVSASEEDGKLAWYENDGLGNFSDQIVISGASDFTSSSWAVTFSDLQSFDVDLDGDTDVLFTSETEDEVGWYENIGEGEFGSKQVITAQLNGPFSVNVDDLNQDGVEDIVAASSWDNKLTWYEGLGGGLFGEEQLLSNPMGRPSFAYSVDIDSDGLNDIVVSFPEEGKISWFKNEGEFTFTEISISENPDNYSCNGDVYDMDGDGDADILASCSDEDKIIWFENDGIGNFGEEILISDDVAEVTWAKAFDSDGDGDVDIVTASWLEGLKTSLRNQDGLQFGEPEVFCNTTGTTKINHYDLDGDSDLDLLYCSWDANDIIWRQNDGNGNFLEAQIISDFYQDVAAAIAIDLNGDGDLDVLAASVGEDKISWFENDGIGNFENEHIVSSAVHEANSVYSVDLDLDGDADIVASAREDDHILWFENDGNGNFSDGRLISDLSNSPRWTIASDLDNDGDNDIISLSYYDEKMAVYENLSGNGCTNELACNFNSEAWIDNGSCCFEDCGCTDPLAVNFDSSSFCDDESCRYEVTGVVFYDQNQNGIMDGIEYGLPFQTIQVLPSNITLITNDSGEFSYIQNSGMSTFILENTLVFQYNTTPNPQVYDPEYYAENSNLYFGVTNEEPYYSVCVDLYPSGNGFLCNEMSNHNICFRNMGNVPIDGVVELEYDELFQGHSAVSSIDSVDGNKIYMSFANLLPGQMFFYDVSLLTPTADHIGEFVTSYSRIYGYHEGNQVAYGEQELTMEITCAYDPNDKQAFPQGYTDGHLVLQDTEQEFLIRFQNTGNAPAQNIRIQDTLDVNWDLSTLQVVANSHSVMTAIKEEERVIDFYFEDIQLPDSVNNEPDSHGLISYKISPLPNLPVNTVLENTAYIYFDNNDPIITNTTWTTIHECGGEADFELADDEICVGEEIFAISSYELIDTYGWNLDFSPGGDENSFTQLFDESGDFIIQLVAENQLCSASTMHQISVYDNPSSEFETSANEACLGESLEFLSLAENVQNYSWNLDGEEISDDEALLYTFTESGTFEIVLNTSFEICSDSYSQTVEIFEVPSAEITENGATLISEESDAELYLWFLNGELIPNANSQYYEVLEDGNYSVIVISEDNCSTQSEEIFVVNILEPNSPIMILYPNPTTDVAYLEFYDSSEKMVRVIDAMGKEVIAWDNVTEKRIEIYKSDLSTGNYAVQIVENGKEYSIKLIVQ